MKKSKMNFTSAIFICYKKYFDFKGRAKRPEFWWFALYVTILSIFTYPDMFKPEFVLIQFIFIVIMLFSIIPYIAVAVRRLHDLNMTGWYYLINFIPIIGVIIFLITVARPGMNKKNRFGK